MKSANVKFLGPMANQARLAQSGLVGLGRLEFDGDRIRFVGKRGKKALPGTIAGVVGFVCMLAAIIFLLQFERAIGRGAMKLIAMVALVAGVVPGAFLYNLLLAKLPGIPVDKSVRRDALKVHRATRERIELESGEVGGFFALKAADPQSEAVLAESFAMAQTLPR
jgi:hypothetical protein